MHFVSAAASWAAALERYLLATPLSGFILHLLLPAWKAALYRAFPQCKASHAKNGYNTPINAIYSSVFLFLLPCSLWFSSLLLFGLPQRHYTRVAWMSNEDNLNTAKSKSCLEELIVGAEGGRKKFYLLELIDWHDCANQCRQIKLLLSHSEPQIRS